MSARPNVAQQQQLERIKKIADERQIGLLSAKRIVMKEDLIADIKSARDIEDIQAILLRIVECQ